MGTARVWAGIRAEPFGRARLVRSGGADGRKLRRTLVRGRCQRPQERTRSRPDDRTDRKFPMPRRARGPGEDEGAWVGRAARPRRSLAPWRITARNKKK